MMRTFLVGLTCLIALGSAPARAQQGAPQPAAPPDYRIEHLSVDELTLLAQGLAARQREIAALIAKITQQIRAQELAAAMQAAPKPPPDAPKPEVAPARPDAPAPAPAAPPDPPAGSDS